MSQETLVPPAVSSHSSCTTAASIPSRPPTGYEALPCEDSEDHCDVELGTRDGETAPITSPSPAPALAPRVRNPNTPAPRNSESASRTRLLGVLKMLVILTIAGLPSALFFSIFAWLVGGAVLQGLEVPPYDSADPGTAFKASLAGAPVVALAVGALAFVDFVVRRLPKLRSTSESKGSNRSAAPAYAYDQESDIYTLSGICAPASVLAMPLGLLMMPRLATETFGAWNALGWSVTGLGVSLVGFGLGALLPWVCCTTVHL